MHFRKMPCGGAEAGGAAPPRSPGPEDAEDAEEEEEAEEEAGLD